MPVTEKDRDILTSTQRGEVRGESVGGRIVVARRDELLTMAALLFAPLQDSPTLRLPHQNIWKQCRIDLNKMRKNDNCPDNIDWS